MFILILYQENLELSSDLQSYKSQIAEIQSKSDTDYKLAESKLESQTINFNEEINKLKNVNSCYLFIIIQINFDLTKKLEMLNTIQDQAGEANVQFAELQRLMENNLNEFKIVFIIRVLLFMEGKRWFS